MVVATDYAGLGVSVFPSSYNESITHQYLANPAAASDVIYSVVAARSAFSSLGLRFVSISQYYAKDKIQGYLGGVAISPTTDIRGDSDPIGAVVWAGMFLGLKKVFPQLEYLDIFTEDGFAALNVFRKVEGGGAVGMGLLLPLALQGQLLKEGWKNNEWAIKYNDLIMNGGKEIAGPLLIIHGEEDPLINFHLTEKAVYDTVKTYPNSQLEFLRLPNTHDSAITDSQWVWMDWIKERFDGREVGRCREANGDRKVKWDRNIALGRPEETYGFETTFYLAHVTEIYHTF